MRRALGLPGSGWAQSLPGSLFPVPYLHLSLADFPTVVAGSGLSALAFFLRYYLTGFHMGE